MNHEWKPELHVEIRGENLLIQLDLSGVQRRDVSLTTEGNWLRVQRRVERGEEE